MGIVKGTLKEEHRAIDVPDVNYRALKALNQSMITTFEESPADFVRQFILGEEKDEEDTPSTLLGNLIDDLLLTYKGNFDQFDDNFDKKYALYTGVDIGTKQVFMLADELFKISRKNPEEDFKQRFLWAFDAIQKKGKYKGKTMQYALNDFTEEAQGYFQTKLDNIGKLVVSEGLIEKSKKIATRALDDAFVKGIYDFSEENEEEYVKLTKLPITFIYKTLDGEIEGKAEIDHMDVDYKNKLIIPRDTKSTYDNTAFPYNYKKNRYYIQNAWYSFAIRQWAHQNDMDGFTIAPFEFVVHDTSNGGRRPLRYKTSIQMLRDAENGWEEGGRRWKGIVELVTDIIWSNENGEWGMSKEAFLNHGIINL